MKGVAWREGWRESEISTLVIPVVHTVGSSLMNWKLGNLKDGLPPEEKSDLGFRFQGVVYSREDQTHQCQKRCPCTSSWCLR